MKKILILIATSLIATSIFAQNTDSFKANSASAANRKTAIRYLKNAKQHAAAHNWSDADSLSQIGLEYDSSIADLWYIHAAARHFLGDKRATILPLIENALETGRQWVDYNYDNARILYADILSNTLQYSKALDILDAEPFVYSADSEYIRIKSYYNISNKKDKNSQEALKKARNRVDTARKVYPEDIRFVELFYNYEYKNCFLSGEGIDEEVQRIADSFASAIKSGKNYKNISDDLKILSIVFSDNDDERLRLLKTFNSEGHKSIHFAEQALVNGIFDEIKAVDYFYLYSDASKDVPVNFAVLKSFASKLKNEEIKKEFAEYLNSFNGVLVFDTDDDMEINMTVVYKRGRPESIKYDKEQNGIDDWEANCDFGVPNEIKLEGDVTISYGNWPYIDSAVYCIKNDENQSIPMHSSVEFKLISEKLLWTPFEIEVDSLIKENFSLDFFIPVIPEKIRNVNSTELLQSSSYYVMSSNERPNAFIKVIVLSGIPQSAKYYEGDINSEKFYAIAQFENGLPHIRLLDSDGDGLFEIAETYGFTKNLDRKYISESEEMQIITNIFGTPAKNTGFYVKEIHLDKNGDTIPEFIEEYTEGYGKISSWDTDSDGSWDIKYVKHPLLKEGDSLIEECMFHQPFTNEVVIITSENSVPKNVSIGNKNRIKVIKGLSSKKFYWIVDKNNTTGTNLEEDEIIYNLESEKQGVAKIIQISKDKENESYNRFYAVKFGDVIFAEKL